MTEHNTHRRMELAREIMGNAGAAMFTDQERDLVTRILATTGGPCCGCLFDLMDAVESTRVWHNAGAFLLYMVAKKDTTREVTNQWLMASVNRRIDILIDNMNEEDKRDTSLVSRLREILSEPAHRVVDMLTYTRAQARTAEAMSAAAQVLTSTVVSREPEPVRLKLLRAILVYPSTALLELGERR